MVTQHIGRHIYAYHTYMLNQLKNIHSIAKEIFNNMFNALKQHVTNNPGILYN